MGAADTIRAEAHRLGFDAIGFAPARLGPEVRERLQEFLAAGMHGGMGWMEARADQRADPRALSLLPAPLSLPGGLQNH